MASYDKITILATFDNGVKQIYCNTDHDDDTIYASGSSVTINVGTSGEFPMLVHLTLSLEEGYSIDNVVSSNEKITVDSITNNIIDLLDNEPNGQVSLTITTKQAIENEYTLYIEINDKKYKVK